MTKGTFYGYSVIIPAYKSDLFVEECLESIRNQTLFKETDINHEILIGIDGCPETLQKVKNIMHRYDALRVFYFNKNSGPYITKNTLITKTKYNYLLFFDSDDLMHPDMVSKIDEKMNAGYDVCRFNYIKYDNNTNPENGIVHDKVSEGVTCHKKKVHKILGGFEEWPCGADSDFRFKCDNRFNVSHIETPLFFRRIHPNSLTKGSQYGLRTTRRRKYLQTVYHRIDSGYYKNPEIVNITPRKCEEIT